MESFDDKLRSEHLNTNRFSDLREARRSIEAWRREYNHGRPHSSLGGIPPALFAAGKIKTKDLVTPNLDEQRG